MLPEVGQLLATGDAWEPYRLLDPEGQRVEPVAIYFKDLLTADSPATTLYSYGNDLLRWWRFLWAQGIEWDRAVREDARDFTLWMQLADKPVRVHWRHRGKDPDEVPRRKPPTLAPGTPNLVTGKPTIGKKYSPATRAHSETVLRTFYDFHLDLNSGQLLVNPFPLDRRRRKARPHAHHNPADDFKRERTGRYRPAVPQRIPRRIPDDKFTEVFAGLRSHRDRALLAFWVSSAARSTELLTATERDALPGQQLIGVIRKGTRDYQQLPASPDAFVWLRLYQEEAWRKGIPRGRNQPLWWTLRRPWRPLNYDAARAMFTRAVEVLGANWTLHDLRHTATYRMTEDPEMSLVYVQHILGHKDQSTLQKYLRPSRDEVISAGLAHHARQEAKKNAPSPAPTAPAYNEDSLNTLFGGLVA
ncbi:Phage Integrase Family Protein [Streptomyces leeuwenhoekii]|uniref:Phage Integrase Family Protein n=1 Tax=Streptomyces leeuwenhoekii TaxID=1437453 RepID=A0A0F7VYH1_STRLW|nr:Phage Integrase Family Protein [Streptomyces leeuwenhoekii]